MTEKHAAIWFYARNGQQHGPYTVEAFKAMARTGSIQADDLVWKEGLSNWIAASQLKGLLPSTASVQPPPLLRVPDHAETSIGDTKQDVTEPLQFSGKDYSGIPKLIDELDISDEWKLRFRLLEKAGAANHSWSQLDWKGWPTQEVMRMLMGKGYWSWGLAFIFGIFYYAAKGLWKKGLILLLMAVASLSIAELIISLLGFDASKAWNLGMALPCIYAAMSGYDFYRLKVHGEEVWPSLNFLNRLPHLMIFSILVLAFSLAVLDIAPEPFEAESERGIQYSEGSSYGAAEESATTRVSDSLDVSLVDIRGLLTCGNMFCDFGNGDMSYGLLTDSPEAVRIRTICGQYQCEIRAKVSGEEILEIVAATVVQNE